MAPLSPRQAAEVFHLLFLSHLGRRLDKRLYAVKGGCNLRFFLGSLRYSEDLDLDVETVAPGTLRKSVSAVLEGAPLRAILKARGLEIASISEAKQTKTTQRWKARLTAEGLGATLNTKIEFSRRGLGGLAPGRRLDPVAPTLIARYGLPPILVPHYSPEEAFRQKVRALAGRASPQARDVFDLAWLLDSGVEPGKAQKGLDRQILEAARETALSLSFVEFRGQVGAYLDPEDLATYGSKEQWDNLVLRVVDALERKGT